MAKAFKFECLHAGTHQTGKGVKEAKTITFKRGDLIEDSVPLHTMYPNKFKLVKEPEVAQPTPIPSPTPDPLPTAPEAPQDEKKIALKPKADPRGKDVSADFKVEEPLKVFTKGSDLFHVYDGDKTDPLNGKKGLAKDAVGEFVKKYLEE